MPEKISEYGYQEKTKWHYRHHGEIGNGGCEHNPSVSEKIYKAAHNDF
jgi:hypothetical protein